MGEKLNLCSNWDTILYKGLEVSPKLYYTRKNPWDSREKSTVSYEWSRWSSQVGIAEEPGVPDEGLNRLDHPLP